MQGIEIGEQAVVDGEAAGAGRAGGGEPQHGVGAVGVLVDQELPLRQRAGRALGRDREAGQGVGGHGTLPVPRARPR